MLNGIHMPVIYMDETADINPKNFGKCRACGTWKLIHYKIGDSVRFDKSCDEYVPSDNLEYLEYEYQKKIMQELYSKGFNA